MAAQLDLILPPRRECIVPDEQTQQGQILRALQRGDRLTVMDALTRFQCYALSQRIGELKRMGWPIVSEPYKTASGKTVARYSMEAA